MKVLRLFLRVLNVLTWIMLASYLIYNILVDFFGLFIYSFYETLIRFDPFLSSLILNLILIILILIVALMGIFINYIVGTLEKQDRDFGFGLVTLCLALTLILFYIVIGLNLFPLPIILIFPILNYLLLYSAIPQKI